MLSWFDIEFTVEGVFVYFPGVGAFEIAHGCSGLRYLLVGSTLSLLYGELNYRKWSNRFWLLLAGILFSLIANWVRVFVIIYMGYESNMTSSLIKEHDFFGWWVFAATLVPLFFVGRWLEKRESVEYSGEADIPARRTNQAGLAKHNFLRQFLVVLPVLVVAGVTWFVIPSEARTSSHSTARQHSVALVKTDQWLPLFERQLAGWRPDIDRPDRILENSYLRRGALDDTGNADRQLFVALYSYDFQRPGREVVQYSNRLYDSSAQLPEQTFTVDGGDDISLSGLTLRYRRSEQLIHLAYGYYVEGHWESNDLRAKLAQLPGIFNARTDASLLVIGFSCDECDAPEVLSELGPAIRERTQEYLDQFYSRNSPVLR
jgi:exosortase/archaeosortase family protein